MAPKRPSPLEKPPTVSSLEEHEKEVSSEEGSGSKEKSEPGAESQAQGEASVQKQTTSAAAEPKKNKKKLQPKKKASGSKPPPARKATKSGGKRARSETSDMSEKKSKKSKNGDEIENGGEEMEELKKVTKLFQRIWSEEDEARLVKGMHEFKSTTGTDPATDMPAFLEYINKSLVDIVDVTMLQLKDKIRRLKRIYKNNEKKIRKPKKDHESKMYELSKRVWGRESSVSASAALSAILIEEKGWKLLGLSEAFIMEGLERMDGAALAELVDKWTKLHLDELELSAQRSHLMHVQAKLIREAFEN